MMYNKWYGTRKERTSSRCLLVSETERGGDITSEPELGLCANTTGAIFMNHTIKCYGLT